VRGDLDDTLTLPPQVASARLAEPDSADTAIREQQPIPLERSAERVPSPQRVQQKTLYYGFRIGSSAIVLLDAIAYIGRRPSAPRVVRGGSARLVRVKSPTKEVSSTHLELRQTGSAVVVQDLGSTNGTRVAVPGHPSRTLRPGESLVVTVGTLIDIGDRNVLEILPLQERP
jgi:pSer/pThr/pTyr-binding forkhead associated (FHA) protein